MRGLPIELRERIVAAHVEQGLSVLEVAELFGVSHSSVRRYVAAAGRGDSLAPKSPPGLAPKLGKRERDWLLQQRASMSLYAELLRQHRQPT